MNVLENETIQPHLFSNEINEKYMKIYLDFCFLFLFEFLEKSKNTNKTINEWDNIDIRKD